MCKQNKHESVVPVQGCGSYTHESRLSGLYKANSQERTLPSERVTAGCELRASHSGYLKLQLV